MGQPYICLSIGFFTHRKTLSLVKDIGPDGFWVPVRLWTYAALNQQDGDFSFYANEQRSEILGLAGRAKAIDYWRAMQRNGFLDGDKLHDWEQWNGFHKQRSIAARTAAEARWGKREPQPEARNGASPPESPPPPESKRPGAQTPGHETRSPLPRGLTDSVREAIASAPEPQAKKAPKTIQNLSRKAFYLGKLLEDHKGRPESPYSGPRKAEFQADYKKLKTELAELRETLARS